VNDKRTYRALSDFSKGKVIPKYLIVEMTRPVRTMSWILFLLEALWMLGWISLANSLDNWWLALPTVLPILFRDQMYRLLYRWRQVGLITLKDDEMVIDMHDRNRRLRFADQAKIKIWTVITTTTGSSARMPQYAMIVGVQLEPREPLLILNEMYLTPEDRLQFMRPPPSFGTLMFEACRNHGVKTLTKKGEPWADWLDSR